MFDLSGKRALVTGASGGLGREIARALHGQGAEVILSGTREETVRALAAELGERSHVVLADLSNPLESNDLFSSAEEQIGDIHILINNAGLTRDGLLIRMKDEDWHKVLEVNLTAIFRLCRAAAKSMMKRRMGRIINISSVVGVTGNPGQGNYCASKAGLIGFSKAMALELASRGVTVNCVAPGFITSPMTDVLNEDQRARILQDIPQGHIGEGRDVAAGVVYLASDEASYVTGQTLHINGGMAMI